MFGGWTGDIGGIANVNATPTTYTMGSAAASITATYKAIPNTLSLSTASENFGENGGNKTVNVTSNVSWSISTSDSWMTVSPASGSNNGSFTITTATNTGAARSGSVTVSGGGLSETINVTQDAYTPPPDWAFIHSRQAQTKSRLSLLPKTTRGKSMSSQ